MDPFLIKKGKYFFGGGHQIVFPISHLEEKKTWIFLIYFLLKIFGLPCGIQWIPSSLAHWRKLGLEKLLVCITNIIQLCNVWFLPWFSSTPICWSNGPNLPLCKFTTRLPKQEPKALWNNPQFLNVYILEK